MIRLAVIMLVGLVCYVLFQGIRERGEAIGDEAAWQRAADNDDNLVGRILMGVSRPLADSKRIQDAAASPQWRWLDQRLGAAGGVYGGSVEVFLCVQFAALVLGGAILAICLAFHLHGAALAGAALGGFALTGYPYSTVSQRGKKRSRQVNHELPDFAELLQMPLNSGFGIIPALNFTAKEGSGPVAVEVRAMLAKMRSRPGNDAGAFADAGRALGTPEAVSFFNALASAHTEGARVSRNLAAQAAALRVASYEQSRSENLKLPTKLIIICGIHLMPMLLIVALLPAVTALKDL